ncbi:dynein light chain, putative [Trypanosoma equiperdum]|uniref:Dynein light chain n=4 Tax=Trypanozoon TaxID=39700 RepID=Q387V5_TRYB2|nr:dynein light chain, putative [Trypanosoma brucei gambiense DAL972]XP_828029.1 dynein light chain, putative [Trypanosoma brucei brucei TREU927]RHW69520.1 dynein light chain [Trypanosoma brucei equiperdum]SCU65255.1 dynein light chain, putative [Trypanosoma equiperdum]EAN78917.1 dynein light chain, putative [Trypanosoma brucei brucei TREU927]CBH16797.1 dynein light chain, putative [Trypanosoma brucei gambiense DAL972]|eukprot:XP_011779061.1 dynein light chain, putative [Trypanosoma brucei gambiense DAL972]
MAGTTAIVKDSAMSRELQQDCIDCAAHALHVMGLNEQTAMAQFITRELNSKYGSRFHCVVGRSFGSYVGHDSQYFIYFLIGDCAFLIWRTVDTFEERVFYAAVDDIAVGNKYYSCEKNTCVDEKLGQTSM